MPSFVGRVVPVAAMLAFAGCNDLTGPESLGPAQRLWESRNLSSYHYVVRRTCFCVGPVGAVEVAVHDDEVVRAFEQSSGTLLDPRSWPTVDDLFAMVQSADANDRLIKVEFHEDLGYPTRIEICCLEDDSGVRYVVTALEPMVFVE